MDGKRPTSAPTTRNSGSGCQNDEKKIYWCNYDDLDSSAVAVTYQPDWIIEALGLKPISPEEAAKIKVGVGDVRGTTTLVFPATKSGSRDLYADDDRLTIATNGSSSIVSMGVINGTVGQLAKPARPGRGQQFRRIRHGH